MYRKTEWACALCTHGMELFICTKDKLKTDVVTELPTNYQTNQDGKYL